MEERPTDPADATSDGRVRTFGGQVKWSQIAAVAIIPAGFLIVLWLEGYLDRMPQFMVAAFLAFVLLGIIYTYLESRSRRLSVGPDEIAWSNMVGRQTRVQWADVCGLILTTAGLRLVVDREGAQSSKLIPLTGDAEALETIRSYIIDAADLTEISDRPDLARRLMPDSHDEAHRVWWRHDRI